MRGLDKTGQNGDIPASTPLAYLRPSQTTELLGMEIDSEADSLSRLQNPLRLRHVEHSLLAEHVHVLDGERAAPVKPINLGKLVEDDILSGLLGTRAPETREESLSDSLGSIRVTFPGRLRTKSNGINL